MPKKSFNPSDLDTLKALLNELPSSSYLLGDLKFNLHKELRAFKAKINYLPLSDKQRKWFPAEYKREKCSKKELYNSCRHLIIKRHYQKASSINKANDDFCKFLKAKYSTIITKDRYPQPWMINDPLVDDMRTHLKMFDDIFNFIFNYNRYWRAGEFTRMKDDNKQAIGKKYTHHSSGKKWDYASFWTNAEFYEKIQKDLEVSKELVRKYMQEACRIGFMRRWKYSNYWLYSDGYFTVNKTTGRLVKHPFLTKSYLKALREFNLK